MNSLISKRVADIMGKNHSKLDLQIKKSSQESMKLLHECEEHLLKIGRNMGSNQTDADKAIRKNLHRSLAQEITEKTILLRKQQKYLYEKMKESNGTAKPSSFKPSLNDHFFNSDSKNSDNFSSDDIFEMETIEEIGQESLTEFYKRDAEINNLVDSMNELGNIFKQLNNLIIEQGNILDRIDYNIESSLQNTKKANKELKKAERAQDRPCAKYCIFILVMMIFGFSIVLILKFKK